MAAKGMGKLWTWVWAGIVLTLLIFVAALRLFWHESTQVLDTQLKQRLGRAKAQLINGTLVPAPETYAFLHRRTQQLQEQYQELLQTIDPPGRVSTEGAQDPGLYFREQLHTLEKRLEREAAAKGVPVALQFGFPEDLPASERVPLLLRQLALVELASTTLVAEGATSIDLLRALDAKPVEDPQTREAVIWELPLMVRARCRTSTLVKFLYRMQQAKPLVAAPEISLKALLPAEDGMQAELVLTTYASAPAVPAAAVADAPEAPSKAPAAAPRSGAPKAKRRQSSDPRSQDGD